MFLKIKLFIWRCIIRVICLPFWLFFLLWAIGNDLKITNKDKYEGSLLAFKAMYDDLLNINTSE